MLCRFSTFISFVSFVSALLLSLCAWFSVSLHFFCLKSSIICESFVSVVALLLLTISVLLLACVLLFARR